MKPAFMMISILEVIYQSIIYHIQGGWLNLPPMGRESISYCAIRLEVAGYNTPSVPLEIIAYHVVQMLAITELGFRSTITRVVSS